MASKLKIKTFGIARELMGGREVIFESNAKTVGDLRNELLTQYPELKKLNSVLLAVNAAYAEEEQVLQEMDEIAIIPPVSGG